jgi:hypothetical protein
VAGIRAARIGARRVAASDGIARLADGQHALATARVVENWHAARTGLCTQLAESSFKHHRRVEHYGAAATRELEPQKKSIYSLIDLRDFLLGCNRISLWLIHLNA